jgi:CRP-like cAMP-binding protein
MSLDADVRRLSGTRPFNLLPREALQLLAFSCERREYKAGEALFAEGDAADAAFFVLAGEITLSTTSREQRAAPGALIGETALAAEVARGANAVAAVDSAVLRVSRATFRRVLEEFPQAALKIRAGASARMRDMLTRLEDVRARGFEN